MPFGSVQKHWNELLTVQSYSLLVEAREGAVVLCDTVHLISNPEGFPCISSWLQTHTSLTGHAKGIIVCCHCIRFLTFAGQNGKL